MLTHQLLALLLLAGALVIMILAWGSFCICSGFYVKAFCRARTDKKLLSLTFDDGPHPDITPMVLDLLRSHNIKAGFFLIGKNIEENRGLVKRMVAEGHVVGNHSYAHTNNYGFLGTKKVVSDLEKNEALIESIIGQKVRLFRPPFGVTNPNIGKAARLLDYSVVGWSIRSLDTIGKDPQKTIKRVIGRLKPGRVILLHDDREHIIPILKEVIEKSMAEGYEFVSPDELLNIKAYK